MLNEVIMEALELISLTFQWIRPSLIMTAI